MLSIVVVILLTLARLGNAQGSFDLNVIHVNDFHDRFDETNDEGGECNSEQCIGGFSRLYRAITDALVENPDSLVLNGGDNFQGTLWYSLFKWNVTQHFLNQIPFDAVALGNHEFDDGIDGVTPFLESSNAPVIATNIDDSLEPRIRNKYQKSIVVERKGKKIGIIGVILKSTNEISSTENLKFLDESESVNAEAERLVNEEQVFTNIILSHSGYDTDKEIASKATAGSKIGLIVGAHSHTFLYTGDTILGPGRPAGPYPTIINRNGDGKNVLIVQASSYCRYLGNIRVSYDEDGNSVAWSGQPIFLGADKPQDEEINQQLEPWKTQVNALGSRVIGNTLIELGQGNCRTSECLLGNFVTDSMVHSYIRSADTSSWTYASLAVFNPGGLRNTIAKGNITYNAMITAQPFANTFDAGDIEGRYIKEMFEFTLTPYDYGRAYVSVNLLQVSGFRVVFNLTQPIGSMIESIKVRCNECRVPIYEDLDLDKTYRLIVPSFLTGGGDGFIMIRDNLKNVRTGRVDIDLFIEFLEARSPFFEEVGGRITFVGDTEIRTSNLIG